MKDKPKILILNGLQKEWHDKLADVFPSDSRKILIDLKKMNIQNCQGCMSCTWNMEAMNPGYCVLKDDMATIYPTFVHSDLMIVYTEITLGGFSHPVKKCVDRLLPVLYTAPLKKRGRDVGHFMRYEKRPGLLAVGISENGTERASVVFREFVERLAALWALPFSATVIHSGSDKTDNIRFLIKDKINSFIRTAS